jgi:hypothetical protein
MKPAIIIVETLPITAHHKRVFCHQKAFIALCFGTNWGGADNKYICVHKLRNV